MNTFRILFANKQVSIKKVLEVVAKTQKTDAAEAALGAKRLSNKQVLRMIESFRGTSKRTIVAKKALEANIFSSPKEILKVLKMTRYNESLVDMAIIRINWDMLLPKKLAEILISNSDNQKISDRIEEALIGLNVY